jgi:hypothetical protein
MKTILLACVLLVAGCGEAESIMVDGCEADAGADVVLPDALEQVEQPSQPLP